MLDNPAAVKMFALSITGIITIVYLAIAFYRKAKQLDRYKKEYSDKLVELNAGLEKHEALKGIQIKLCDRNFTVITVDSTTGLQYLTKNYNLTQLSILHEQAEQKNLLDMVKRKPKNRIPAPPYIGVDL